ncbi:MAG: hypothetical protein ACJAR3_001723 [Roseivirga sp.]|jgi:hypothetical protein
MVKNNLSRNELYGLEYNDHVFHIAAGDDPFTDPIDCSIK